MADRGPVDTLKRIAADFDRIARVAQPRWTHNTHYHRSLFNALKPAAPDRVLEVGCGTGRLAAKMTHISNEVVAIDLSHQMIAIATTQFGNLANVRFVTGDYLQFTSEQAWDAIISVATVHHMHLPSFLAKAARELQPGGQLIVLDLYRQSAAERLLNAAALPVSLTLRLWYNRQLWSSRAQIAAWKAHAQHDQFLSLREIRNIANEVLPGCVIRRKLFWRYLLCWDKPA